MLWGFSFFAFWIFRRCDIMITRQVRQYCITRTTAVNKWDLLSLIQIFFFRKAYIIAIWAFYISGKYFRCHCNRYPIRIRAGVKKDCLTLYKCHREKANKNQEVLRRESGLCVGNCSPKLYLSLPDFYTGCTSTLKHTAPSRTAFY